MAENARRASQRTPVDPLHGGVTKKSGPDEVIRVLSPTGHVRIVEVTAALRPGALADLRPGILENRKANARLLMESMIEGLRERVPLGPLTVGSKPVAGPPSQATVELLKKSCDFVVVGSSD